MLAQPVPELPFTTTAKSLFEFGLFSTTSEKLNSIHDAMSGSEDDAITAGVPIGVGFGSGFPPPTVWWTLTLTLPVMVAHDVLTLRPRSSGMSVRDATLYVRSSDAVPTRVRVHDTNGGTLAFDLRDVRRNVSLPTSTFRFDAPRGTEVVDLR